MLLSWGIERADAEGLEAYLDASPSAKPLYEKFGWVTKATHAFLGGTYIESFMVRPSKAQ